GLGAAGPALGPRLGHGGPVPPRAAVAGQLPAHRRRAAPQRRRDRPHPQPRRPANGDLFPLRQRQIPPAHRAGPMPPPPASPADPPARRPARPARRPPRLLGRQPSPDALPKPHPHRPGQVIPSTHRNAPLSPGTLQRPPEPKAPRRHTARREPGFRARRAMPTGHVPVILLMGCQRGGGGVSARLGIVGCHVTIESETPMTSVIAAEGLTKRSGTRQALAGVDIAADRGQVLALLGPNGAGKTTIVRVLSTLLRADSGRARICGHDVLADAVQVRQLIALTGQYASVDDELTGTENLIMIGRLLGFGRARVRARAPPTLQPFAL